MPLKKHNDRQEERLFTALMSERSLAKFWLSKEDDIWDQVLPHVRKLRKRSL